MPIENASTSAGDLGPAMGVGTSHAENEFSVALQTQQTITPDRNGVLGQPNTTLRLDPANVVDTPFRTEFAVPAGSAKVRVRQDDGSDQHPNEIRDVRLTGGSDVNGRYLFSADTNGTVTAGGSIATPGNNNISIAGTVSVNTTPDVVNATRLQGNAVLVPSGSPVGLVVGGSTNRLDGDIGSSRVEGGFYVPTGSGGRGASLDPNGVTVGVRTTSSETPMGEASTTEGFVRASGVSIGPASIDAEVAVGPNGQTYSATGSIPLNKNNSVLVELNVQNNDRGSDAYSGAIILKNTH